MNEATLTSTTEHTFALNAFPLNWYEVAKLLYNNACALHNAESSDVIRKTPYKHYRRPATNRSVFLLSALAMENLIKAFLVYENPAWIEGGKLHKKLRTHKLTQLQGLCTNLPSPQRTRSVLGVLESGMNSWARYPCALSAADESQELLVTSEFWLNFQDVFKKYSEQLERLLEAEWEGPYAERYSVTFR